MILQYCRCRRCFNGYLRTCLIFPDENVVGVDDGKDQRSVGTVAAAVRAADLVLAAAAVARDGARGRNDGGAIWNNRRRTLTCARIIDLYY